MSANDPVFQDLLAAYQSKRIVVFAGSGVSVAAGLPTLKHLAENLRDRLRSEGRSVPVIEEIDQLLHRDRVIDALSAIKLALGPRELGLAVVKALDDSGHDVPEIALALAALAPGLRGVLTTCLDNLLNRAFQGAFHPLSNPTGDIAQQQGYFLKLHGTLQDRSTWVFLREEYDRAMFGSPQLQAAFGAIYRSAPILFVGCDLADENLELTLAEVRAGSRDQPPTHYALLADPVTPFRRRNLQDAGLRLITYANVDEKHGELAAILRRLAGAPDTASPRAQASPPVQDSTPAAAPAWHAPATPVSRPQKGLPRATLTTIHVAALETGLVNSRGALLSVIDSTLVAALPAANNLAAQMLSDLTEINQLGRLPDQSVPLAEWLQTALTLVGPRHEARVFEEALAALAALPT